MNALQLTKEQIKAKIAEVLKTGQWMIRRSDNGVGYNEFKWQPIGMWTECPDKETLIKMGYSEKDALKMAWNDKPECGGGATRKRP